MDCKKVGQLILSLRKEKNYTQKQLADKLNISDRTISKWERGVGCPDVTLLADLSNILGVNIEKILNGALSVSDIDGGNMKKIKFYQCLDCDNIVTSSGNAEVSCCGRRLTSLVEQVDDDRHHLNIETVEDDYYITFNHEMTKKHYISFIAYVTYDRCLLIRLYPEQSGEVRIPKRQRGKIYFGCNQHGLWVQTPNE